MNNTLQVTGKSHLGLNTHTHTTHCRWLVHTASPWNHTWGWKYTNNTLQVTGTHSSPMKSHLRLNTHKQHTAGDWYTQLPIALHVLLEAGSHLGLNTQTTHCRWLVHTASPSSVCSSRSWVTPGAEHKQHIAGDWYTQLPHEITPGAEHTNNTLQVTGTHSSPTLLCVLKEAGAEHAWTTHCRWLVHNHTSVLHHVKAVHGQTQKVCNVAVWFRHYLFCFPPPPPVFVGRVRASSKTWFHKYNDCSIGSDKAF